MLNETITKGLHNPDCAFYVGTWIGGIFVIKWLFLILVLFFVIRSIDNILIIPLTDKFKEFVERKLKSKKQSEDYKK